MIEWLKKKRWRILVLLVGVILWLFGDLGPEPASVREAVAENWNWVYPSLRWIAALLIAALFLSLVKENSDASEQTNIELEKLKGQLKNERKERINAVKGAKQLAEAAQEIAGPATSRLDALESRMSSAESRLMSLEAKRIEETRNHSGDGSRSPVE